MKRLQWVSVVVLLNLAFCWNSLAEGASAVTPWGPISEIQAAARREGSLVIYTAPGHAVPESQRAISKTFGEEYGIRIDWTTLSGADIAPRVLAEQRTKQNAVDVVMSGIAGNYSELKPRGYVVPILAQSTLEKGVWRLDPAAAMPKDRDWLFINMPLEASFFINTDLVPAGTEPKSYQDLLDPKWKGKIVLMTPASGGSGSGWFRATYRKLGLDYMRALAKQVVLVPNHGDVERTVVRGQYPIGLAPAGAGARQLIDQGAPAKQIHPKEGSHLSVNGIEMIANSPHPNAAKLFFQWFYSKEGQTTYARSNRVISVRKDVPQDYLPPDQRYYDGAPFMIAEPEDFTAESANKLLTLGRQIFVEQK